MRSKKTIEQLREEKTMLEALQKDREERVTLEAEVKRLRMQVKPSKFQQFLKVVGTVNNELHAVGRDVVAGAKAFDQGLQKLDDSYSKAVEEANPTRKTRRTATK